MKTKTIMLIAMLLCCPCWALPTSENNFAGDPNVILLLNFENNLTDDASGQTVDNDGVTFDDNQTEPQGSYTAQFNYDTATIQYANLDADMPLTSTGTGIMTICFWIYQSNNQVWHGCIAGRYDSAGGNNRAYMLYSANGTENLVWIVSSDGGSVNIESHDTGYKVYQNRWLHVGFRWNNSTRAYDFRVWDDTDQAVECEDSGTFSEDVDVSQTTDFTIGQQTDESTNGLAAVEMDELVIFNRWLTDAEIDKVRKGEYGASSGAPQFIGRILGRAVAPWEWMLREATWRDPDARGQRVLAALGDFERMRRHRAERERPEGAAIIAECSKQGKTQNRGLMEEEEL